MYIKQLNINTCLLLSCDYPTAVELMIDSINKKEKHIFSHLNLYNYYLVDKYNLLKEELSEKIKLFFEGIGLKTFFFLMGKGSNKDINGTDLQPVLFKKLSHDGLSVFLIGANSTVIEKAFKNIKTINPQLIINGIQHGYIQVDEESGVVKRINDSDADLLIIGMGTFKEFQFINRNYELLNVKAIWNVGGLFDFISGSKPRAPKIFRIIRLEWLFRLLIEPRQKFIRIFYVPFWFIFHLIKVKLFSYNSN